jgi:hypothetical protein
MSSGESCPHELLVEVFRRLEQQKQRPPTAREVFETVGEQGRSIYNVRNMLRRRGLNPTRNLFVGRRPRVIERKTAVVHKTSRRHTCGIIHESLEEKKRCTQDLTAFANALREVLRLEPIKFHDEDGMQTKTEKERFAYQSFAWPDTRGRPPRSHP